MNGFRSRKAGLYGFVAPVLIALCLPACAQSAPESSPLAVRFDKLIEEGLKEDPLSGIAVGVVRDGKLIYARGFGVMTIEHPDRKVTPQTLFHMASITKTFVATSIMQLWEQGKIDLDAPVTKYVTYFRIDDPRYKSITVRQMLTHSSGMPDVEDYQWNKPQYDDGALERYVRSLGDQKLKLLFDPGSGMAYSNMAYEVLGDLVAKVSGETFEDYVEEHILKPLKMSSSTLLIKKANPALLADGYMRKRGGDYASLRHVNAYPYNRIHTPSSDLMSSVGDMARYAMANLNHGELDGARILKPSTYKLMWKPAVDVEFCHENHTQCRKPGAKVGISWFLEDRDGMSVVAHSGGDDGFMTDLVLIPGSRMALVLMANTLAGGTTLPQKIVHEFLDAARQAH